MGRRPIPLALLVALLAVALARPAHAEEAGVWEYERRTNLRQQLSDSIQDIFTGTPRLYWDRGIVLETEKKALGIHVGYEGQFDAAWYGGMERAVEEAAGAKWVSGFGVRRSRISFEGFVLKHWYFRARYGWTGAFDEFVFQDLFVEWSGLTELEGEWWPVLRLGQVKEAMTIDWMNSPFRSTFAERAMFTTSIVPNRNPGLRLHGTGFGKRLTYQVGTYAVNAAGLNEQKIGAGESVTARLTGLPWAPEKHPNRLLHLGVSASYRFHPKDLRLASTPESAVGPEVVDTGDIPVDSGRVFAGELFFQWDRFSFMTEGALTQLDLAEGGTTEYWGWYAQVSCFLTPNHIPFNRSLGVFGRVRPKGMIFNREKPGWGAWEVAARFSILDLDNDPYPGGMAWNVTLGLNWYARDNMRFLVNYVYTNVTDAYGVPNADGTMNTLLARFAYDL